MNNNKRLAIPSTPCVKCNRVRECEDRGPLEPCKAFRRYENNGQSNAAKWTPADMRVFDQ